MLSGYYKLISSIEEIVYIEQDWPEIPLLVRRTDGWQTHRSTQLYSLVHLESINLSILVSAFYQCAPFPEDTQRP